MSYYRSLGKPKKIFLHFFTNLSIILVARTLGFSYPATMGNVQVPPAHEPLASRCGDHSKVDARQARAVPLPAPTPRRPRHPARVQSPLDAEKHERRDRTEVVANVSRQGQLLFSAAAGCQASTLGPRQCHQVQVDGSEAKFACHPAKVS